MRGSNCLEVSTSNLLIGNRLFAVLPGRIFRGPHLLIDRGSDHYALEAWERMTTGGLRVPCLPGHPYAHAVETPTFGHRTVLELGEGEWA